jgi:ABC-type xylose transport system substrate-binding protein
MPVPGEIDSCGSYEITLPDVMLWSTDTQKDVPDKGTRDMVMCEADRLIRMLNELEHYLSLDREHIGKICAEIRHILSDNNIYY